MFQKTKLAFNAMCAALCEGYGVQTVAEQFSIDPTIVQALNDALVEQSAFLQRINIVPVRDMEGEVLLGHAASPASGRTDTSVDGQERKPRNLLGLKSYRYKLAHTDSDTFITYETIDFWAKFPDLGTRYANYVQKRIANDRELIGWYGTHVAPTTNLNDFPNLEDVNKGWMQYVRDYKPENILASGGTTGKIKLGAGGDYFGLDSAVNDLAASIPSFLQAGLVAFVGRDLITAEKNVLYNIHGATPTEKIEISKSLVVLGGLPWETPTNFPARGLVVTSAENLSIYHQDTSWRRHIVQAPQRNRVEDFQSRNEGYVVECPEKFAALEFTKVQLPDGNGGWL